MDNDDMAVQRLRDRCASSLNMARKFYVPVCEPAYYLGEAIGMCLGVGDSKTLAQVLDIRKLLRRRIDEAWNIRMYGHA